MRTTRKNLRSYKGNNKKTRKNRRKVGGHIDSSKIFDNILSIGFEIETNDLIKFTLTKDEITGKYILVNSALINYYLEYGFVDPNEYTYIIDTKDESFKITNDSTDDSGFNELVEKIYYGEDDKDENEEQEGGEEDFEENEDYEENDEENEENEENDGEEEEYEDDENKFFIVKIPPNQYLTQPDYAVKFREGNSEETKLHNFSFSCFTDTEFIATYYNPVRSSNIIKEYLFKSIRELRNHLDKLVTINNSKMTLKNHGEEIEIPKTINQSYVLPNTTLVYFNSSLSNIQNYNIREDLDIVIQMTFSCNIIYCYRIMKQLLSLINIDNYEKQFNKYSNLNNKNIQKLSKKVNAIKNNTDYYEYVITRSMNIVNSLFTNYNNLYKTYPLDNDNNTTRMIKSYMFLIIYKLFTYLNSYVKNEGEEANLLKYWLPFAVRHYNYNLFLELKKVIKNAFNTDDTNASTIINQILDDKILNIMYDSPAIKNKKTKLNIEVKNDADLQSKYYGDPLFSIKSYFEYFDKFNADWLEANGVDEKSTKFDLKNDVIIIEFRDFPLYTYLELFSLGNDEIKNEIIKNDVGVFNMRILNHFVSK
jgi:hypothetical protein